MTLDQKINLKATAAALVLLQKYDQLPGYPGYLGVEVKARVKAARLAYRLARRRYFSCYRGSLIGGTPMRCLCWLCDQERAEARRAAPILTLFGPKGATR